MHTERTARKRMDLAVTARHRVALYLGRDVKWPSPRVWGSHQNRPAQPPRCYWSASRYWCSRSLTSVLSTFTQPSSFMWYILTTPPE